MGGMDQMHDDEVRAKLGLAPLGRPMTVEERITMMNLRAMPEPDDETDIDFDLLDLTTGEENGGDRHRDH